MTKATIYTHDFKQIQEITGSDLFLICDVLTKNNIEIRDSNKIVAFIPNDFIVILSE